MVGDSSKARIKQTFWKESEEQSKVKVQGIMPQIVKWGGFSFVKAYGVCVCVRVRER